MYMCIYIYTYVYIYIISPCLADFLATFKACAYR